MASSSIGVGGGGYGIAGGEINMSKLWEALNTSREDVLNIRQEFNAINEGLILLNQTLHEAITANNIPDILRAIQDANNMVQGLERRYSEINKKFDAINDVMIELKLNLDKLMEMHGDKEEKLKLKKGIEEILLEMLEALK